MNSPRPMYADQSYKELEYSELIDLLAEQTAKYTQALVKGDSGNTLDYYRNLITSLSKEIENRQASSKLAQRNNQAG